MMGTRVGRWVGSMRSWMGGVVAERVELAQVIGQLRQELSAAMREGEGEDLRFELGTVELELTVAVSREAGPNAKV
ncbi:MAG: trypco2 family protein, partial [Pseudonocardiaceae bacterium]